MKEQSSKEQQNREESQQSNDCHEQAPNGCSHGKKPSKVVVQQKPEEQKSKVQLQILGIEPFVIEEEEEEANFISCRIGSIQPNALKSSNLKILQLRNNLILKIEGLEFLNNLIELELYDNKIVQIEGLETLIHLEMLDLSYNNIKKIENISHLTQIKKLYLLSNKIKKIENLHFPQLQMLELGSNKIREIQNLEGVSSIKSFFIGKNRITEIKNLEPLKNLEQIALGPNRLTEINKGLLPLKNTLRQLYMQENQIKKLQNLYFLEHLQILDVSYNKIEHLEGITQLSKLQCLYLNGNAITEYKEINELKANSKLTTISLFGNELTKEPGYRMKLVELLPEIDDIDGTPMKTTYNIVFGSSNQQIQQEK